jgi:serine protease Do
MNRYLVPPLMVAICAATLRVSAVSQEQTAKPAAVSSSHQVVSRVPGDILAQLSGSLQQLATKVSPAVVQIEVSGFGPGGDGARKDAALVVRQHAVGSGVIVAPDGYIMTNAHVVEGAQRVRVVLWHAPTTFNDVSSSGYMHALNAKVIGLQREPDLAVLKVEASNFARTAFQGG